jgi:hypothetical protein
MKKGDFRLGNASGDDKSISEKHWIHGAEEEGKVKKLLL